MLTALERDVVVELCKCNISKLYNQNLIHLYYIRLAAISLESLARKKTKPSLSDW